MEQRQLSVRRAMNRNHHLTAAVLAGLLLAACGPAATATPTPAATRAIPVQATATLGPLAGTAAPTPGATTAPRPTSTPVARSSAPKYGGVLTTMQTRLPPRFDFQKIPSGGAMTSRGDMVFQALFNIPNTPTTGCDAKLEPVLAKGFRWVNDTTLEIEIRSGVKFPNRPPTNGRAFTADDAVFGIKRLATVQSRLASTAKSLADVKVKEGNTVTISLKEPFADLPGPSFLGATLYGAHMVSKEASGPDNSLDDPNKSYVGTGPFMFQQYVDGVAISFVKNPDYWKPGLPYLDGVKFLIVPDPATEQALLRAGRADVWNWEPTFRIADGLRKTSPQIKAHPCLSDSPGHIYWRVDKPPLNDVRVRRALSMAIDRKGILQALLGGNGEVVVLGSPASHGLYLRMEDLPPDVRRYYEYRPEEAKQLLAEAGYPGGNGLSITLGESPARELVKRQVSEAIVEAWNRLGVKATLNLMEYGQYTTTVLSGNYEGVGHTSFYTPDFYSNMAFYLSSAPVSQNRSHVADPELDKLVREFIQLTDLAKQAESARRVQLRVAEQMYSFGHVQESVYSLWQPWVNSYGPVPKVTGSSDSWAEIAWMER